MFIITVSALAAFQSSELSQFLHVWPKQKEHIVAQYSHVLFKERVSQPYLTFHFIESSEMLLLLAILVYLINVEAFLKYIAIFMLN